jgi:hypothetical protein
LNDGSGQPLQYSSLNGYIRVAVGTSFAVSQATAGINFDLALPQVINAPTFTYDASDPAHTTVATDFDALQMRTFLQTYIRQHTNAAESARQGTTILTYGNDTYWGGKPMQEYAELALIAKQVGDQTDYTILLNNLRTFMTDWFTYDPAHDTTSHFFAYYPGSHALIGFSPSYGSENFTDNHFHYGYFAAAAGVLALLDPTWAAQYGAMAKMVAMQYANWLHPGDPPDVNDPNAISLPFLRTFEPWLGHSYAGGTGSGGGNNQESTSEAIQSWLGLVLLGQALNDPAMTSAGMMGYTIESKAVQQQWFNNEPNSTNPDGTAFPSTFADAQGNPYSNVGIHFDGAKSHATYFGVNPEYILGIQALPIWPSLDLLGRNSAAAAAATQNLLANRRVFYRGAYDRFASFEGPGGQGGTDWLNIILGFQATYDPQATANEYGRILAQQTPTAVAGTTGLYYYFDHSYQTYGNRDWSYHLSVPLGGVYTHGSDGTTMANTRTYMAYIPGTTAQVVQVFDGTGTVIDTFTAQPGFNVVTRSTNGGHAPPIITVGAASNPATVIDTPTAALSVLATNEQQNESTLTYTWVMASGPTGAQPAFSLNGTNAAKNTPVTFDRGGFYQFVVTVTDVNGLSTTSVVAVTVISTAPDLALRHPALASSIERAGFEASKAFDGDSTTRWSSQFSDPQWISVDLGSTYNINEVKLNWENAAGKDYLIQVSDDGINWTTIQAVTGNATAGWHDYPGLSGSGRYVRMYGTARVTPYGYSLWDFNVYGSAGGGGGAGGSAGRPAAGKNLLAISPFSTALMSSLEVKDAINQVILNWPNTADHDYALPVNPEGDWRTRMNNATGSTNSGIFDTQSLPYAGRAVGDSFALDDFNPEGRPGEDYQRLIQSAF